MIPAKSKREDETQVVIPDFEIENLARCLLPKIQEYYDSPEGQAAFEKWKQAQTDRPEKES